MERRLTFNISAEYDGKTVKELLHSKKISASMTTRLKKRNDGIMLNGKRVFVTETLRSGDVLKLLAEDKEERSEFILPVEGRIDIIYEDEDFLAVNKPPYLPVHPSKGHPYDSLANIVAYYYKNQGQSFTFRCVNRLDKDTSGVTLIAKNAYAHELMRKMSIAGEIRKAYTAIVHGTVKPPEGVINLPIFRPDEATIKRKVAENAEEHGKEAITEYSTIISANGLSMLSVRLLTGRTHQIRVHFSYIGHPLAGDFLYGDENDGVIGRQALHCRQIAFTHPVTGKELCLKADIPEDMKRIFGNSGTGI